MACPIQHPQPGQSLLENRNLCVGEKALARRIENLTPEEILSALNCPVCDEVCVPPSYICDRGHLLCQNCRAQVNTCPSCRSRDLELATELHVFLKQSPLVGCRFQNNGCKEVRNVFDTKIHEASCIYGQIYCPVKSCEKKLVKLEFEKHIRNAHSDLCFLFSALVGVKIDAPDENVCFFTGLGRIVTFKLCQNGNDGITARSTFEQPDMDPPKDVHFELLFKHGEKSLKWRGPVLSTNDTRKGSGFHSNYRGITSFVEQNNKTRELVLITRVGIFSSSKPSQDLSSKGTIPECTHFLQRCYLVCSEDGCGATAHCEFCHDEMISEHSFQRSKVTEIDCFHCKTRQQPKQHCEACGIMFAEYFCPTCVVYADKNYNKSIFHCDKCGVCRCKQRSDSRYFHCETCNSCFDLTDPAHLCEHPAETSHKDSK